MPILKDNNFYTTINTPIIIRFGMLSTEHPRLYIVFITEYIVFITVAKQLLSHQLVVGQIAIQYSAGEHV